MYISIGLQATHHFLRGVTLTIIFSCVANHAENILYGFSGSSYSISNSLKNCTINLFHSNNAMFHPIHVLDPYPNYNQPPLSPAKVQTVVSIEFIYLALSGFSIHRSGRNSSASTPKIIGSRFIVSVLIPSSVPAGRKCSAMVIPSGGA
jgi:hypothetical protein